MPLTAYKCWQLCGILDKVFDMVGNIPEGENVQRPDLKKLKAGALFALGQRVATSDEFWSASPEMLAVSTETRQTAWYVLARLCNGDQPPRIIGDTTAFPAGLETRYAAAEIHVAATERKVPREELRAELSSLLKAME